MPRTRPRAAGVTAAARKRTVPEADRNQTRAKAGPDRKTTTAHPADAERAVWCRAYFFAEVTMNGETEAGAVFLSALGLRTSLLDFF
jgi:hypothetical protein